MRNLRDREGQGAEGEPGKRRGTGESSQASTSWLQTTASRPSERDRTAHWLASLNGVLPQRDRTTYRLITVAILPVLFSLKRLYKYLKLSHYWIYHETFTHLLSICSFVFRKQIVKFAAVKRLVISKTKEDGFLVIFTVCTTRTNTVASADEPISPSTNSSVPSATDKNKSHEVLYNLKCFAQT